MNLPEDYKPHRIEGNKVALLDLEEFRSISSRRKLFRLLLGPKSYGEKLII